MHTFGRKRGHSVNHLFLSRSELVLGLLESYSYKKNLPQILFCFNHLRVSSFHLITLSLVFLYFSTLIPLEF